MRIIDTECATWRPMTFDNHPLTSMTTWLNELNRPQIDPSQPPKGDLKRSIDKKWLLDPVPLFIFTWSCFSFENMKISSFKQLKYDILLWRLDILGQPPTRMVFFISNSQNHLLLFEIIYYALILQQPNLVSLAIQIVLLTIGAESDHWLCLSLTP